MRAHAIKIRKLLSSQVNEEEQESMGRVRIWRALYYMDEYEESVCAASIIQTPHQPLLIQYQIPATRAIPTWGTVIQVSGPYVSVEEIAVFLGLDQVEPDEMTWTLTWAE